MAKVSVTPPPYSERRGWEISVSLFALIVAWDVYTILIRHTVHGQVSPFMLVTIGDHRYTTHTGLSLFALSVVWAAFLACVVELAVQAFWARWKARQR